MFINIETRTKLCLKKENDFFNDILKEGTGIDMNAILSTKIISSKIENVPLFLDSKKEVSLLP